MMKRVGWVRVSRLMVVMLSIIVFNGVPQSWFGGSLPLFAQSPDNLSAEWSQFGQNASRTNFAPESISGQVQFAWDWNSAGSDGKTRADHLLVADLVQPITGGSRVYMVAGDAVYALDQATGTEVWQRGDIGTLTGTPVYQNEAVYVGSNDGSLYQLDAASGEILHSVDLQGAIFTSPLATESMIIVATVSGTLAALEPETLDTIWQYDAGSELVTAPAYSAVHDTVVVVAKDLFVHALDATSGEQKWRIKPTVREYSTTSEEMDFTIAEDGWPVIAEQHGIVFIRYRLEWNTLWALGTYPTTNEEIRAALIKDADQQALFALALETGETAFIPAVGNGGAGDGGDLPMGPMPVIREVDGQEVAYIIWRNGLTCAASDFCDGREDAAMGEMVLDDDTVEGYQAGDVRFVQFDDIQTDEMMSLTMIGDMVFHGHWLIDAGRRIVDRSATLGATFKQPIRTEEGLYIIWRQCDCPPGQACNPVLYPGGSGTTTCAVSCPFSEQTRYCPAGLFSYGDQRGYPAGFYQYHNDIQKVVSLPFTIGSGNMVFVKTRDGGLMAFTSNSRSQNTQTLLVSNRTTRVNAAPLEVPTIAYTEAMQHIGQVVKVCGTIESAVDHLPKAVYLSFSTVHDGQMLVRVFQKDLSKFDYDPATLTGQDICVSGLMRLYYPELNAPEIIVDDPRQIVMDGTQ